MRKGNYLIRGKIFIRGKNIEKSFIQSVCVIRNMNLLSHNSCLLPEWIMCCAHLNRPVNNSEYWITYHTCTIHYAFSPSYFPYRFRNKKKPSFFRRRKNQIEIKNCVLNSLVPKFKFLITILSLTHVGVICFSFYKKIKMRFIFWYGAFA